MRGTASYRTALVLASVSVVLVASVLAIGLSPRTTPGGSPATPQLSLAVTTDRATYRPGDFVNLTVRVQNQGPGLAELEFGSACQATFRVEDRGGSTVYDWLAHHGCLAVLTNLSLAPGANKSYGFLWDQRSDDGVPVPTGTVYRVVARLLNLPPIPAPVAETEFLIEPPAETLNLGFSAATDRAFYSAGVPANVSITLTNLGMTTATLHFGNPCFMEFLVYASDGALMYNSTGHWGCIQVTATVTLPPGASTTRVFPWNLSADNGMPLPPSQWYTILPRFIWGDLGYQQYVTRTDTAVFYLAP